MELNQIPAKKEKVDYPHFIMEGFGPININVGNPNDVLFSYKNIFKEGNISER